MLPIGEISSRLSQLVAHVSYFELVPFGQTVFTSSKFDVAIRPSPSGGEIDVAEPECGYPDLSIKLLRDKQDIRKEIETLWAATRDRRKLLHDVMDTICKLNSGNLNPNASIRMSEIAKTCDLHITTVARVLDNKVCLLDTGAVFCRDYIYELRSREK